MPHHGDQHKGNGVAAANPFEEPKHRISGYTAQEIATLQSRLNKRLGPEFISTRPGPGNQKIAYLSAEKAINLANEVFGFNGWSSSIQQIAVDFVEENPNTGKVSLGLSVIVRVTLRDGTYHEDIGYGGIENCKGKAMAFEKSKKEATTDALKRALRNFGNVLGNCIYDRNFVTEVSKVKAGPGSRFDVNDLHRHPDYAPKPEADARAAMQGPATVKGSSNVSIPELDDSFDMGEFDDADFDDNQLGRPDEILLPIDTKIDRGAGPNNATTSTKALKQPAHQVVTGNRVRLDSERPQDQEHQLTHNSTDKDLSPPGEPTEQIVLQQANQAPLPGHIPSDRASGFYSAKAAQNMDLRTVSSVPANAARFNPHSESPSIRKTVGVDHHKSVPVRRDTVRPEAGNLQKDFVDPKGDGDRRMSRPNQTGLTPVRATTSLYRPPTRHGSPALHSPGLGNTASVSGIDKANSGPKRPPLADVSNAQHTVTALTTDGVDAKRQRLSGIGTANEHRITVGSENG